MRNLYFLCLLLLAGVAQAATEITAYIQITNTPAGLTSNITVNIGTADIRYWTNNAGIVPSVNIQTTNSRPASVTNLVEHFNLYPVYSAGAGSPQALFLYSTTNTTNFTITAPLNTNLTVTFGGNWATLFYVTNTYSDANPILTPTNAMSARVRTNAANAIVNLLSAVNTTNSIPLAAKALTNYVDIATAQTGVSNKTLTHFILNGPGRIVNVTNLVGTNFFLTNGITQFEISYNQQVSNALGISGVATRLTNGYWTNATLGSPIATNLVNYGNAIRSEGSGGNSLQLGSNATASGTRALAVGVSSAATNTDALAVGTSSSAGAAGTAVGNLAVVSANNGTAIGTSAASSGSGAVSIGNGAIASGAGSVAVGQTVQATAPVAIAIGDEDTIASGTNSLAVGGGAVATETRSVAFGDGASANYKDSMAIGINAASTTTNQIVLGTSTEAVTSPGIFTGNTHTNTTLKGTNVINGRVDFTSRANSGLANGNNAGVILGTNVYVRLSGATTIAYIGGFAAEQDGSFHILQFSGAVTNTFGNESGVDPTAANRIVTGTGADLSLTNNPLVVGVIYDATASRWRIVSFHR